MWLSRAAFLVPFALLAPSPVQAGVADFVAGCIAAASAPETLPSLLAEAGMTEIDPEAGPPGPSVAIEATGRRLWSAPPREGQLDAFTGYAPPGPGRPIGLCWHLSRPGETPAQALAELRRRYPPESGVTQTGTEAFYGGFERWPVRIAGEAFILGISWPMREQLESGAAYLYVVRPSPRD